MMFRFILQYLPISSQKAKGVDECVALSQKTAACTPNVISYPPAINVVNRCNVFDVFACTLLHPKLCHIT